MNPLSRVRYFAREKKNDYEALKAVRYYNSLTFSPAQFCDVNRRRDIDGTLGKAETRYRA